LKGLCAPTAGAATVTANIFAATATALSRGFGPGSSAAHAENANSHLHPKPTMRAAMRPLVPHVRQSFNWDCGFACTEMVLRALGVPPAECSLPALRKMLPCESTSIWTVDLAYVMHQFGVDFRFLTMTLGVDPTYKHQSFYKKTLDDDAVRVTQLFQQAEVERIDIERRSLSRDGLSALMRSQDNMVMVLVDRRYLYPVAPGMPGLVQGWISHCMNGYIGHYVLLVGYDAMRDGYYLYDPARTEEPQFVKAQDLHNARRSHGTDEDIIVVPWSNRLKLTSGRAGASAQTEASFSGMRRRGVIL